MLSDEQAEPEWTATPARSRPMSTGSASTPCTPEADEVRAAGRGVRRPDELDARRRRAPPRPWRRCGAGRSPPRLASARRPSVASAAAAAPKASRAGHRLEPSPAPPFLLAADEQRLEAAAPADDQRPGAGHAAELVRADADQVGVERGQVHRTCPQAAAASTCTVTPGSRHRATTSCTGWRVPTSWLAHWQCTSAGRGRVGSTRGGRRSASTSSRPAPSTASVSVGAGAGRRVAHGRVLDRGAEHRRARVGAGGAPDGGVDRLGGAGGEDDLARRDAEQLGHLLRGPARARRGRRGPPRAGGPGSAAGRPAHAVERGERLGARRRGAGVVEVGASHRGLRQRRRRCRRRAPATTG